jgi:hypothetical protein
MGKALDWLRSNGADLDGDEVPDFSGYDEKFGTVDSFGRSAEEKAKGKAHALDWLRDKDPNYLDDLDDLFSTFPGTGPGPKSNEQLKAEAMAKALGWLGNKGFDPSDEDAPDFDVEMFGLADDLAPKSAEERARETANALNWLRNKGGGGEGEDDEESSKFQKLRFCVASLRHWVLTG